MTDFDEWFEYVDGSLFWKKAPGNKVKAGSRAGGRSSRYETVQFKGKMLAVHRVIFAIIHGRMPECIDHIDGNSFNNRIENLREASNRENQYNSRRPQHNTSGVKGVSWDASESKWRVQIKTELGRNWGRYASFEEACSVADNVRNEHHKEFARCA